MPVGIAQRLAERRQAGEDLIGNEGTGVGQSEHQRAVAPLYLDRGHAASP
jgi:hypothetical protein